MLESQSKVQKTQIIA